MGNPQAQVTFRRSGHLLVQGLSECPRHAGKNGLNANAMMRVSVQQLGPSVSVILAAGDPRGGAHGHYTRVMMLLSLNYSKETILIVKARLIPISYNLPIIQKHATFYFIFLLCSLISTIHTFHKRTILGPACVMVDVLQAQSHHGQTVNQV